MRIPPWLGTANRNAWKATSKYEQHADVGTDARVLAATRSCRAGLFDRHDVHLDPLGTAQHSQRQRDSDPLVELGNPADRVKTERFGPTGG